MSRSKDPLALSPHWHVDYRIEAELPEDTVVGTRFLINLGFTAPLLVVLFFFGIYAWDWKKLSDEKQEAERFIRDNKAEVKIVDEQLMQYSQESSKIDQAYLLARPQLFVSEFIADIGRTRREQMFIDLIEWSDAGIVLRGGVREKSEQATRILGGYVDELGKEKKIKALFETVQLTDVERSSGGDTLRFEIKFTPKVLK